MKDYDEMIKIILKYKNDVRFKKNFSELKCLLCRSILFVFSDRTRLSEHKGNAKSSS